MQKDSERTRRVFVWLVAFASSMGGFLFGYEIGIINQILVMRTFNVTFGLTNCEDEHIPSTCYDPPDSDFRKGLITSSFLFGCIIGAGIVSVLADKLGRKPVIMLGGFLFTLGGAIQTFTFTIQVLVLSRVLSGVSIGVLSMSVPLYISETSPPQIRGRLTTIYQLMITFGIFMASCVNGIIFKALPEESHLRWRVAFGMQMLPGVLLSLVMLRMPRSPRWLAEKGRHDEGLATIARLRGLNINDRAIEVEYGAIRASIEFERQIGTATWSELFKPGVRRRLIIGIGNQAWQQWTGINVILYYGSELFGQLGFENIILSSVVFVIINAFINLVSTIPGMWGVERFGRRPLLIWGGVAMMISHLMVFAFGYVSTNFPKKDYYWLSWFAIFGIYGFTISFACTWGPVVWTYQSEIFPLRIRAKGTGLSTMSNWFWNFIIALVAPSIFTQIKFFFYLIFAGCCFLMTLWTLQFIPETRGRTLEEMDDVFGDNMAVISTGDWDWRYDLRDAPNTRGAERKSFSWKMGKKGRKRDEEGTVAYEGEEEGRDEAGHQEEGGEAGRDNRQGPGRKNRKRSGTPSPKRRKSNDSTKNRLQPLNSTTSIGLNADVDDYSHNLSTASTSVPNTPISMLSSTSSPSRPAPRSHSPHRNRRSTEEDDRQRRRRRSASVSRRPDDGGDGRDSTDELSDLDVADHPRLERANSNAGSLPSRKSAGTPVPERFLRRKGSAGTDPSLGGLEYEDEDEEDEDEDDDGEYRPYGRRQEDDVDSLEEELGIAPRREPSLLSKIKREREATDAIESRILYLQSQMNTTSTQINTLKPFHEYDISIASLKQERARAIQRKKEMDDRIHELESALTASRSLHSENVAKLNRVSVLVEIQDRRLNELRNKAALVFFGIRGNIGGECSAGSGGFLIAEAALSRKRTPQEVGVLDSKLAVGTREIESSWPSNWASMMMSRADKMVGELEMTRVRLETVQRSKAFSGRFVQWAEVVDQLRVIEAAHHRLRMELTKMEVEKDLVEPEAQFIESVDSLFDFYFETVKGISDNIDRVEEDHKNFRTLHGLDY
ncbi:hypothetical protein HDU67_001701 [Dinochytrium kinnereticum]|nr:hypothetical protein HDU67_001701 [Dinochytrium kinnereticum]